METKHRLWSMLVVAGLVMVLVPFFRSQNDASSDTTLLQPPPFPDQAVQVTVIQDNESADVTLISAENNLPALNSAFAIQLGSFNNKATALRLVNQLRAKGYPAFMQALASAYSSNTRVLIGPEPFKSTAVQVAYQLENDLHVRGIVVSYRPLAL